MSSYTAVREIVAPASSGGGNGYHFRGGGRHILLEYIDIFAILHTLGFTNSWISIIISNSILISSSNAHVATSHSLLRGRGILAQLRQSFPEHILSLFVKESS